MGRISKFLLLTVLIILLIFNCLLLYRTTVLSKKVISCKGSLSDCQIYSERHNNFEFAFQTIIENSNVILDNDIITDSLNNKLFIKELFRDDMKYMLVCRYVEMQCADCVISAISNLLKSTDLTVREQIVFWGMYRNNKYMNKEKTNFGIQNEKIYNTPVFDIPAENNGYPYYFVLDRELRVSDVFIPDKRFPDITNIYLKLIQKKIYTK
jgi:hypothetical protein